MKVDVRGDDVVAAKLDAMGERMLDGRPVLTRIADDLMSDERRRFDSRGFGRWPALKPSSRARKARSKDPQVRANAARVLVGTGRGEKALTERDASGQLRDIGRLEMRFGIRQPGDAYYMRFHQLGKGVPKRLVIQATPQRRAVIREQVRSWAIHGTL